MSAGVDVHRRGGDPGDGRPPAYTFLVFYVVAHQDDWQLFGGEHAFADLQRGDRRVVFVHTTAGDAGETSGLWEAREQAAIASVRAVIAPAPLTVRVVERGGHPVVRYRCGPAVLYFLRLPDGSPRGTGYEATGEQSLSRLRDSGAPIAAVDGSTIYGTWRDFVDTLAAIVAHERAGLEDAPVQFHAADPSPATNPGDHADHTATSAAVQEVARHGITWWRTYCTDSLPPNLAGPPLAHKERLYRAYADELERITTLAGTPVVLGDGEWNLWGDRSYSRTET
jgi:LmbE family N-acetylglucosaminyl deacetylase